MDIHKNYSSAAVIDQRGNLVEPSGVDHRYRKEVRDYFTQFPLKTQVVMEATFVDIKYKSYSFETKKAMRICFQNRLRDHTRLAHRYVTLEIVEGGHFLGLCVNSFMGRS